jgi:hypothetical protein
MEAAEDAGRQDALMGAPMRAGVIAWPGHYADGYRSVNSDLLITWEQVTQEHGWMTWTLVWPRAMALTEYKEKCRGADAYPETWRNVELFHRVGDTWVKVTICSACGTPWSQPKWRCEDHKELG